MKGLYSDLSTLDNDELKEDIQFLVEETFRGTLSVDELDFLIAEIKEFYSRTQQPEHAYVRKGYQAENVGRDLYG